jgi:outer membrane protein assembly factor BamB
LLIVFQQANGTQESNVSTNVLWQRSIESSLTGLIVDDGKALTMAASGNITCFSASDGSLLWSQTIKSHDAGDLTVSNGKVYAGQEHAQVTCLDETTGQIQWSVKEQNASSYFANQAPIYLLVDDGRLYMNADGIIVYNATTGQLLWQLATPSNFPIVHGKYN